MWSMLSGWREGKKLRGRLANLGLMYEDQSVWPYFQHLSSLKIYCNEKSSYSILQNIFGHSMYKDAETMYVWAEFHYLSSLKIYCNEKSSKGRIPQTRQQ